MLIGNRIYAYLVFNVNNRDWQCRLVEWDTKGQVKDIRARQD